MFGFVLRAGNITGPFSGFLARQQFNVIKGITKARFLSSLLFSHFVAVYVLLLFVCFF